VLYSNSDIPSLLKDLGKGGRETSKLSLLFAGVTVAVSDTPFVTIRYLMRYPLGQAAQATGKSKMTIQSIIKKGGISANKTESGEGEIDPAELYRVFPIITGSDTSERIM
jgi:hypothetical protein